MRYDDLILAQGGAVKATKANDTTGTLGGYLVRFGSESETDLSGEYFSADTYFGAQLARTGKAVLDGTLNHRIPMIEDGMSADVQALMQRLAVKFLPPVEVTKDEQGLFAQIVLNLADDYERMLFDMGVKGAWKWSSGSAEHVVDIEGKHIKSWPLIEAGMTPTPAEYRDTNKLVPLKTYMESVTMKNKPAAKSVYFGEYLEGGMASAALNELRWALDSKTWALLASLRDGVVTVEEVAAQLVPMLAEFGQIYISTFTNILTGSGVAPATGNGAEATPASDAPPPSDVPAVMSPDAPLNSIVPVKAFLARFPTAESFAKAMKAGSVLAKVNEDDLTSAKGLIEGVLDRHFKSKEVEAKSLKALTAESLEASLTDLHGKFDNLTAMVEKAFPPKEDAPADPPPDGSATETPAEDATPTEENPEEKPAKGDEQPIKMFEMGTFLEKLQITTN